MRLENHVPTGGPENLAGPRLTFPHAQAGREVLANPSRAALAALVDRMPGINVSSARRALNMGWGASIRHVRILEKNRLLVVREHGKELRLFPPGFLSNQGAQDTGLLHKPQVARIVHQVQQAPGISRRQLVMATGQTERVCNYHLRRLADQHLVELREGRGGVCVVPTPRLGMLMGLLRRPVPAADQGSMPSLLGHA